MSRILPHQHRIYHPLQPIGDKALDTLREPVYGIFVPSIMLSHFRYEHLFHSVLHSIVFIQVVTPFCEVRKLCHGTDQAPVQVSVVVLQLPKQQVHHLMYRGIQSCVGKIQVYLPVMNEAFRTFPVYAIQLIMLF